MTDMSEKLRMMEDEMNRFEEEIGLPPLLAPPPPPPLQLADSTPKLVIGANTYNQVQEKLKEFGTSTPLQPPPAPFFIPPQVQHARPPSFGAPMNNGAPSQMPLLPPPPIPPGMLGGPPAFPMMGPPRPPNIMIPPGPSNMMGPQGQSNMMGPPGPPNMMGAPSMMGGPSPFGGPPGQMMGGPMPNMGSNVSGFNDQFREEPPKKKKKTQVVLSATPQLYPNKEKDNQIQTKNENTLPTPSGPELPSSEDLQSSQKKKKAKEMAAAVAASIQTIVQTNPLITTQPQVHQQHVGAQGPNKKKDKNNKSNKKIRTAGGTVWEDSTLGEWEDDDFRLFCGDLGNDVTDELLVRTFSKYPSFLKAKVVRDKRTNKTKGFGFVSFKDPQDFIRANKEMNGRYVGSRPIKLRKSNWKNRSLEVVRKKEKEKATLIGLLTGTT